MDESHKLYLVSHRSQTQKTILYDSIYMFKNGQNWYRMIEVRIVVTSVRGQGWD